MTIKPIILGVILSITAPISTYAGDSENANKAIKEAKLAYKAVKKAGFAWRDTEKIIKKAEELAKDNANKAIKLANQAKKQAEMGMEQAKAAKRAGPRF